MAYLHCHKCGWSQDDFWNKSYNAIRFLLNWEDELLNEKFKQKFPGDSEWRKRFGDITYQEVIAQELERHAQKLLQFDIDNGVTTPVWECIKYES